MRKVGVSAVKKKKDNLTAFSAVGKESKEQKIQFVKSTIANFQTSLMEFAIKYKDRINADPEFRQQFHNMCNNIGVDPLASNKGFWGDILGVGDYYYELGVSISHICMKSRPINGGIISVDEIVKKIRSSGIKSRTMTSVEDVKRAVGKLSVLGNGFRTITLSNRLMIMSVPSELNRDHETLFKVGQDMGCINVDLIVNGQKWTMERFHMVVNSLLRNGMLWVDVSDDVTNYYFPSIWMSNRSQ